MKIAPRSKWIMAGDSITACQRDESNPTDLGKGYVSFVDGLLTACYPSHHIRVLNRGVPGDTIRELKTRWQSDVLDLQPDWLSICIGINDVWQQFDGKHAGEAIFVDTQAVFDSAVEQAPVETLAWDRAHLTIPGHMILARAVLQAVEFEWSGK